MNLDIKQQQWVDETLASLSLDARIGQLLHPMLTHYDADKDQNELIRTVIEYQTGGAFLFSRSYKVLREVVRQVTPHMNVPLLLSGDYEAGANGIDEGARFGSSMNFAAIGDLKEAERLTYHAGKAVALQGAAVGANWTFAPVVDINSNHQNPITNVRSYGDDVERISALAAAYIQGLQDHGMAACIKHFPGDGQDSRDQHVVTSINPLTLDQWEKTYGRTFRAGIAAGVYTVMMGHITMPHLSSRHPKTGLFLPATMDSRIQLDLLRNRLGFDGLIISDAIEMGGIVHHSRSEGERVVWNLETGSDMVLFVSDVKAAVEAIHEALDHGVLSEKRIDDAVRRILSLKAKVGLHENNPLPSDAEADEIFLGKEFAGDVTATAEESITLVRDLDGTYPLRLAPGSKIVLYTLPMETYDTPALFVGEQAGQTAPKSAMHLALEERGFGVGEKSAYNREIENADALIYISHAAPQPGRGSIRLSLQAHVALDRARIVSGFPTLFLSLGNPYVIWELSGLHNFACGYSNTDNIQRAFVRAMLGEIPFSGKLPVKIPDLI